MSEALLGYLILALLLGVPFGLMCCVLWVDHSRGCFGDRGRGRGLGRPYGRWK